MMKLILHNAGVYFEEQHSVDLGSKSLHDQTDLHASSAFLWRIALCIYNLGNA